MLRLKRREFRFIQEDCAEKYRKDGQKLLEKYQAKTAKQKYAQKGEYSDFRQQLWVGLCIPPDIAEFIAQNRCIRKLGMTVLQCRLSRRSLVRYRGRHGLISFLISRSLILRGRW